MLLRCSRSIAHRSEIRIPSRTLARVNHCAAWCASASSWAFGVKSHPLGSLWRITLHELVRSSSTSSCIMRLLAHHLIAARTAATTVPTSIEIDASSAQSTLALKLTRASRRLPILNVLLHIAVAIIVLVVVVVVLRLLRLLIGEHASSSIESPAPVVPCCINNILLLHLRL